MKNLLKWGSFVVAAVVGTIMLSCSPKEPSTPRETQINPPTELTARVYESGDVYLRWGNDKLSTGYEVKITPSDGDGEEALRTVGTYYINIPKDDLEYSTSYNWSVRTLIDDRASEWMAGDIFTTNDKPDTSGFIGNWQVAPEDVDVLASIAGNNIELSQLMSDNPGSGETMTFVISEFKDEDDNVVDNRVTVNMGEIAGLPIGDVSGVSLALRPDGTLTGSPQGAEPVEYPYEFPEPVSLAEIPGLSGYLESMMEQFEGLDDMGMPIPDLSTISITSVIITVKSVAISAGFPDPENTSNLRFNVDVSGNFGITTVDGKIEQIMGIFVALGYDLSKMTITATIDSEKSIE